MNKLDELFDEIEDHGEVIIAPGFTTQIHGGDQPVGPVLTLYLECGPQNERWDFVAWREEGEELVGSFLKDATPVRVYTAKQARDASARWLQQRRKDQLKG